MAGVKGEIRDLRCDHRHDVDSHTRGGESGRGDDETGLQLRNRARGGGGEGGGGKGCRGGGRGRSDRGG